MKLHDATRPYCPSHQVPGQPPLHRILEVLEREEMSIRQVSRRMGISIRTAKEQLSSEHDMTLAELYRWADAIRVPITELLARPADEADGAVHGRAQLVKMMKTVRSLQRQTSLNQSTQVLVERISEQLIELMPELDRVQSWPNLGPVRGQVDLGKAAEQVFSGELVEDVTHFS